MITVPAASDSNISSQSNLQEAIRAAREARARNGKGTVVTVELSSGIYRLAVPIEITAADSGEPDAPLVIRAAPGATVRLFGSRSVGRADLQPISQADEFYWNALPPEARAKARVVKLSQNEGGREKPQAPGVQSRSLPVEVFQKARPLTLARWPNHDYARAQTVTAAGTKQAGPQFGVPADKATVWSRERNLWAGGYLGWDWSYANVRVTAVDPEHICR